MLLASTWCQRQKFNFYFVAFTGKISLLLQDHTDAVTSLEFSRDGRWASVGLAGSTHWPHFSSNIIPIGPNRCVRTYVFKGYIYCLTVWFWSRRRKIAPSIFGTWWMTETCFAHSRFSFSFPLPESHSLLVFYLFVLKFILRTRIAGSKRQGHCLGARF